MLLFVFDHNYNFKF